jgi:hypothetical protein
MLSMMQQATMQGAFQGGSAVRNNSLPLRNNSLPRNGDVTGTGGGMGLDLAAMAQSYAASQQQQQQHGGNNVNGAMEKLCESMRRSAMSRTLVKQLSGRTVHRTPSGRSIQRTSSDRMNLVHANSGRQVARASSSKGLQRSNHGMAEHQPVRRMAQDTKHRMTPTRGVFRHHSSTAAMGVQGLAAIQQQQQQRHLFLGQNSLHNNLDPPSLHGMEENPMHNF